MSLENRNLVVKRDGQNFLLPCVKRMAFQTTTNLPPETYLLFRAQHFDHERGRLQLKYSPGGIWNEKSYQISIEINSDDLIAAAIQNISVIASIPFAFAPRESFNNDINLTERLNATRREVEEIIPTPQLNTSILAPFVPAPQPNTPIRTSLKIQHIKLEDGRATFSYYYSPLAKVMNFEVPNDNIKAEFDAIKNYIAKALGLNRFEFLLYPSRGNGNGVEPYATSHHIDMINADLLAKVADHYIDDEIVSSTTDLSSLDDKLEVINSLFPEDDNKDLEWLLEKVFAKSSTKHYIHLRFLSSKHKLDSGKLMMTGKPLSFIFLIESNSIYFLVWETYNTEEATYLWRLKSFEPKAILNEVQAHIEKIGWLRKGNKRDYINSKPSGFRRIEHEYSGEDFGFRKWRDQFQEFIGAASDY